MTIDVVYLAYYNKDAGYTLETVKSFLNSYKKHPAGIDHSLVIIAKNWTDKALYSELCSLAKTNKAKIIDLPDDGWDFGAYFRVSKMLDSDYVFFLGSSVNILTDNWLRLNYSAFKSDDSIQLVGPMGSWGQLFRDVTFPNYHIRTCAFMLKRELFVEYVESHKFPITKEDTYELEHGNGSVTNFVLNKGYKAVVVDNDGKIFAPDDWVYSKTFRHPHGFKSMVSDRLSLNYLELNDETKRLLEVYAWGQCLLNTKIKIFVIYYKQAPVLLSPVYQPISNGTSDFNIGTGVLSDHTGTNISEKNSHYGELTQQYWVWKNFLPKCDLKYVGFSHYRRFLDFNLSPLGNIPFETVFVLDFQKMFEQYTEENILNCIDNFDIILPKKLNFKEANLHGKNIYHQYTIYHPSKDLDIALKIIKEIYPEYTNAANDFMSSREMYSCLNFVMKKELLNEYLEWTFNILTVLEQRTDWSDYDEYLTIRTPAYISERFLNIWLNYNVKKQKLKVLETTSVLVDNDIDAYMAKCMAQIQAVAGSNPTV